MPYRSPDGSETASFATPGRRLAAAAIDWGICLVLYLIVSIPAWMLQLGSTVAGPASGAVDAAAQAVVLLAPVAYLAAYLRSGHTLGMRALDLHARVASTRAPGLASSGRRSLLSVLFGAAVCGLVRLDDLTSSSADTARYNLWLGQRTRV